MSSADLTLRTCSLGARDTYTGHCAKTFVDSTIKGVLEGKDGSRIIAAQGYTSRYPFVMWTKSPIAEDDEIKDANGRYYKVETVNQKWKLDVFIGYFCGLSLVDPHYDRPATSGTWHKDNNSIVTDVAYRQKHWLDEYLDAGDVAGDIVIMMSEPDYMLKREFETNALDAIAFISSSDSKPLYALDLDASKGYVKRPYAFEETALIHLRTTDKAAITGRNLIEQFEQAIRQVATDHPYGSIRQLSGVRHPEPDVSGGFRIYQTEITLRYIRANDDFTPTIPTVTWGPSAASDGTYIIPNTTYISPPIKVNNTRLPISGRVGSILQKLGMPDFIVTTRHNLDVNPSGLTWLRPQTSDPKTDVLPWQVFNEISFDGSLTQIYQTLDLGWGGTLQVTLEEVTPILAPDGNTLELKWAVYSPVSGSVYKTWFGINP